MKKRIVSLFLALALLTLPAIVPAEESASSEYREITLVISGQTVDSNGNPAPDGEKVRALIYNGVLYLPAGVIPAGLGLGASFDGDTDTLYIGGQPEVPSGPHWELKRSSYELHEELSNDVNYHCEYSFEGLAGGKAVFKSDTSFTNKPYDSWSRIAYYECPVPPAYLQEGDLLKFDTAIRVRESDKGSEVDYFNMGVIIVYAYLVKGGTQMTDKGGRSFNAAAVDGSVGMARGDGDWPVTFEGEVFNALVAGTAARIEFWCEAGSYIWEYEYVVPEA